MSHEEGECDMYELLKRRWNYEVHNYIRAVHPWLVARKSNHQNHR